MKKRIILFFMILITIISACAPKAKSPEAAQENDGKEEAALGVGESAQVTTGINDDEIDPELKTCYDKSKQELNEKLFNLDGELSYTNTVPQIDMWCNYIF